MTDKKYFYGNEISSYGLEKGYVDYRTLSKCFDAVLNNDILEKTYEIGYWEQVNGFSDYTEEIEDLEEKINDAYLNYKSDEYINDLENELEELKEEADYIPEIFQWYIISDSGADLLMRETSEIVYYNEELDMYLWGVTHYGTSWDYVLTNIKIDW